MGNSISSSRSGQMDSQESSMPIQSEMNKNIDSFPASVRTSSSIVEGGCCKGYDIFKENINWQEAKNVLNQIGINHSTSKSK